MSSDAPPPYPTKDPGYPAQQAGQPPPAFGYNAQPPPQQPYGQPQPYAQPGQPGYGTHQTNVVVTGTPTVVVQQFREAPVSTVCPSCNAQIITATTYEVGTFTWLIAGITILLGLWLGCCLIPFCIDGCKDVVHTCPNCRHVIRRWNRM